MQDKKYCYSNSNVLINRLNILDEHALFEAEKQLTFIRLMELQNKPIKGNFDFIHLKKIHEYIFQDVYDWAGKVRTVEIGKGNLFCTTSCLQEYGDSIFKDFYQVCSDSKNDFNEFVKILSSKYADLNALHPFREGNGRTQREFTRLICLDCGYVFDLSCTSHEEMLDASIISFNKGDNSKLEEIFKRAVIPIKIYSDMEERLKILSADDLAITMEEADIDYDYYEAGDTELIRKYNEIYLERTRKNIEKGLN